MMSGLGRLYKGGYAREGVYGSLLLSYEGDEDRSSKDRG
jgi:hypothetical protein